MFWPDRARLIVNETGNGPGHQYSFETNAWIGKQTTTLNAPLSRAVNDGITTYFKADISGGIMGLDYTILNTFSSVVILTGQIAFEDITREKKFYKLQVRGKELDNLQFWGSVNNGSNWYQFGTAANTMATSYAEDVFNAPAELKKGKYIQLKIINSGVVQSKAVIADMSIIYRNRRIK